MVDYTGWFADDDDVSTKGTPMRNICYECYQPLIHHAAGCRSTILIHSSSTKTQVGPGGGNSWAVCTCGWEGQSHWLRADAMTDALDHQEANQ